MNFSVVLLLLYTLLFIVHGKELRIVDERKFTTLLSRKSIELQNAYPDFPSDPTYVVSQSFDDESCSKATSFRSVLVDTCLQGRTTSLIYTCAKGLVNVFKFSDTNCEQFSSAANYTVGVCNEYYGSFSTYTACGTTAYAYGNGDYVATVTYQDSGCNNQILQSYSQRNGDCLPSGSGSQRWNWPQITYYDSDNCTGTISGSGEVPSNYCQSVGYSDDEGENNAYYKYVHVTNSAVHNMHVKMVFVASVVLAVITLL